MKYPKAVLKEQRETEDVIEIDPKRMVDLTGGNLNFQVRQLCEFKCHAVWLRDEYEWILATDSNGEICAIPLKKQ